MSKLNMFFSISLLFETRGRMIGQFEHENEEENKQNWQNLPVYYY